MPQILEIYPRLSEEDQAIVTDALDAHGEKLEASEKYWQSRNYSRSKAPERLQKH